MMTGPDPSISTKGFGAIGVRPAIESEMEPFWQAAAVGQLVVERCDACGQHVFPLRGICRRCLGRALKLVVLEPPGVLHSYTINHHSWSPQADHYPLGLVEMPGVADIRFVGLLAGFTTEPRIGQLLDFKFHVSEALGGLPRVYFTSWADR
jgi:hypothetical protein